MFLKICYKMVYYILFRLSHNRPKPHWIKVRIYTDKKPTEKGLALEGFNHFFRTNLYISRFQWIFSKRVSR